MPIPLQQLGLDRPGLPALANDSNAMLARLIEPLLPPFDLTGIAWVVHNLHRSLLELRDASTCKSNQKLADLLALSGAAATWIRRPVEPPRVIASDEITLWTCLLAVDHNKVDPKLFKSIGGIYFLIASGSRPPASAVFRALLQAALSTRSYVAELSASRTSAALIACASSLQKALTQLQVRAISRHSAATSMVEAKVEKALACGYRFDQQSRLDESVAVRGMTPQDVIETAGAVREGAEGGSGNLLVAGMANWHGVQPPDMVVMPIFATSPGLMRMDSTCSFMAIRLGGVLTELARTLCPGVLVTGDTLYLLVPGWISRLLRPLRAIEPAAVSLKDLPGIPSSAGDLRCLLHELKLPRRITAGKLVADRAQPLIAAKEDPLRIALATIDFSRIQKVATAYPRVTHAEFLETLSLRAMLQGWGDLSASPVPAHGYLSKVTPTLESVEALGARLLAELKDTYPGRNAGIQLLLIHHQAFIRYNAFMLAVALLLRGQEATLVPASALCVSSMPGFNDKLLPSANMQAAEVVFGTSLQHQFRYLKSHYLALADRLEERATPQTPWLSRCAVKLRRIADGATDLPLLAIIKDNQLQAFTHLDLVDYFRDGWTGKGDAIRHAALDVLRAAGVSHASREAMMRHVGGAQPIVSATSAWSRIDWFNEASRIQELLFDALGLKPYGGLIRSLGRKS